MTQKELSLLVADIQVIKSELLANILAVETASKITKRIIKLNHDIDKMNDKNEHYYNLVECCYIYYRLFEAFL